MIYYRQKIDNFTGVFDNYSVIVLHGVNYNYLLRDAKKISDEIAGSEADFEMRVIRYFNQEIYQKRDEIISNLKTKSFFSGRQIIMLNGLPEKDYKIITDIDTEWQNQDAVTIVTMNELTKNTEFKKYLASSTRIALVSYTKSKIDSEFIHSRLAKEGINFQGKEILDTLTDFAKFTSEDVFENELEKIKLFKLYDDNPLSIEDFFDIVSIDYETSELNLAVALAERNATEMELNLGEFFLLGKSPISILQFLYAYFYKLSLIKMYGPNSFEARREFPFLISNDLEKAKMHVNSWSLEQLSQVTNSLTISDLKLRKYPPLFQRSILTQYLNRILET